MRPSNSTNAPLANIGNLPLREARPANEVTTQTVNKRKKLPEKAIQPIRPPSTASDLTKTVCSETFNNTSMAMPAAATPPNELYRGNHLRNTGHIDAPSMQQRYTATDRQSRHNQQLVLA